MVVAQLARLGGQAEVGDGGDVDVVFRRGQREAVGPGLVGLVLQVEGQGFVLEVGQARFFGSTGGVTETASLRSSQYLLKTASAGGIRTHRTARQLVVLPIMRLIVRGLAVAHHGHDIWERSPRTVVLVRVEEDSQALEFVRRTKDRARGCALLGEPQGKAISVQVAGAMDLEFNLDLYGGKP